MEFQIYLVFAATSAVVILSPGPSAILVASQGAGGGWKRAIIGIIGIICATSIYFLLSATGIASLIAASNLLFSIIKWAGVAYLIYLGSAAILSKNHGISIKAGAPQKSRASLFAQGFVVEFANPKALLYFVAILPQFVDVTKPIAQQFVIMGATDASLQLVIYSIYALLGDRLARGRVKSWVVSAVNKVAGAALIFAGIKMASVTASR